MSTVEHRRSRIDDLLRAQRQIMPAADRFSQWHERSHGTTGQRYAHLVPLTIPRKGEQFSFEVNLDQCTGCKACVVACHSLNGLDDEESWRDTGMLTGGPENPWLQTVTTACHHCEDPACANGCPVLAYEKDAVTGIVRHLDDQCIGCAYCILKCPYDVPKYNKKRGIVRKCDMCQQRLSSGEAPACVQACPNEAIAIRIVRILSTEARASSPRELSDGDFGLEARATVGDSILPGAFPSNYTLPTTRYISAKPLPEGARPYTHGEIQPEREHSPLAWMLVLTQMAAGLFLCAALVPSLARLPGRAGLGLLALGLIVSVAHLGQPLRAWRCFLGWRKSWLSREIMAFGGFFLLAVAAVCLNWPVLYQMAAALGLGSVFCSAMVYIDTRRPCWAARRTHVKFFGTALLLGSVTTAALLTLSGAPPAWVIALTAAATAVRTVLLLAERRDLHRDLADAAGDCHRSARILTESLGDLHRLQGMLFWIATVSGLLALTNPPALVLVSLLATFAAQLLERRLFFMSGAAPRMPGVPMPLYE